MKYALVALFLVVPPQEVKTRTGGVKGTIKAGAGVLAPPAVGGFADESIVMDAARRLTNVLITIDGLPEAAYKVVQAELTIEAFQYRPRIIRVAKNTKVRIQNATRETVNVSAKSTLNPKWNVMLAPGKERDFDWIREEVIQITDQIHPWMKAWVIVTGNPFGVITGTDGSFEIANIPAGKWTLTLWHEKLGELQREIVVESGIVTNVGEITLGD